MPHFGYSITGLDKDKTAIASGRDLKCSHKHSREICRTIKGMTLEQAKKFLEQVILLKQAVPMRRFGKLNPHRRGLGEQFKWDIGKFPEKSARFIYEVLSNAESNAEYKGLDTEKCRIIHAATSMGRKIKRYIERAHGRSTPFYDIMTHVEIVLLEE
jgi:large subunit ribosomal protein L22